MSFCMFYRVVVSKEKTFTCMVGRYVWGVAGKASNLSRGAGFTIVRKKVGVGRGVFCLGYWGFSNASKILLGDILRSSFKWLSLINSVYM